MLLDLLGHGRSDKPEHASAYRIDTYADQVFALLDELGADQAVLGGISLGANVSLFAASRQPRRVRGLVLEMPVLEWAVPPAALLFAPLLLLAHYARTAGPVDLVARRGRSRRRVPSRSTVCSTGRRCLRRSSPRSCTASSSARSRRPKRSGRAIGVPTLVLAHRNDLIHPFDDAVKLAARLPDARLHTGPVADRAAPAARSAHGRHRDVRQGSVDPFSATTRTDTTMRKPVLSHDGAGASVRTADAPVR